MADTRLYELEECVSPQADDILLIEESATQTDKKVKVSSLMPTDAVESAVADWLTAHPEATTTVEDGSITPVKLATSTMDLFNEKANTAGEYDDMTVGNAKQLLSKGYTENNTPYIYRKSAGGDRVYEKLIGGTVAWNQMVQNGNFADTSGWSGRYSNVSVSNHVITVTPTSAGTQRGLTATDISNATIYGHRYLIVVDVMPSKNVTMQLSWGGRYSDSIRTVSATQNVWTTCATMWTLAQGATSTTRLYALAEGSLETSDTLQFRNAYGIDLTQLFGSTIADYIYSLEQSTAGAGVAYFRQMFPNDYYAYDTGSLQSVNVASKKVVGFNQWDEEWELGDLDSQGKPTPSSTLIRSKNFISVVSSITYYFKSNVIGYFAQYDANKIVIGKKFNVYAGTAFTTASNARYIKFILDGAYGTTYNHDICINISNASKNGTYEAYEEHTYAFDSDVTLRGIPKLDASNNLYYDGDVYESNGTVTRKYGVVDLGSLTWTKDNIGGGSNARWLSSLGSGIKDSDTTVGVRSICAKYQLLATGGTYSMTQTGYTIKNNYLYLYDSTLYNLDVTAFKTAMSGIYLVYELATATTESADPYINPQIVDADGTEEFVDYAYSQSTRDVAVPVGHESKYMINLRAKIEDAVMLPTLPTTNGTYTLKCTVTGGISTLSWVAD